MRDLSPAFGGIPIHPACQSGEVTGLSPAPNAVFRNATCTRIGLNLYYKIDNYTYTPFWDWAGSVFPGHGIGLASPNAASTYYCPRVPNELRMVCDEAHAQ